MSRYDYDLIRENISAEDAARHLGLEIIRGKARCPFHDDRRPSLSFHRGRFHCFACGAAGSSIDLTAQLLGITPEEAVKHLARGFGIPIEKEPTKETKKQYARRQQEQETYNAFEEWRSRMLLKFVTCYRLAHKALMDGCPDGTEIAVQWQPVIENWLEDLESDDVDRQIQIFRIRKEVNQRCETILKNMRKKSGVA